jgi:hypothetical protein
MTTSDGRAGGHLGAILTALIVALLTGSTAPWWWGQVFGGSDGDSGSSAHGSTTAPPNPTDTGPTGGNGATPTQQPSGCWIVTAPLTQLRRETDPVASGRTIPVATYSVLREVDQAWAGSTIHWFQIQADGTVGWVQDNPTQVANRADACT